MITQNDVEKFIREYTEEAFDQFIWKVEFEKRFNEWLRQKGFKMKASSVEIGRKMKQNGFFQVQRFGFDENHKLIRAWAGIKWKEGSQGSQDRTQE